MYLVDLNTDSEGRVLSFVLKHLTTIFKFHTNIVNAYFILLLLGMSNGHLQIYISIVKIITSSNSLLFFTIILNGSFILSVVESKTFVSSFSILSYPTTNLSNLLKKFAVSG